MGSIMLEKALTDILQGDAILAGYVNTFGTGSRPSIFSEFAPEKAAMPYIVFKISYWNNQDVVVHRFTVDIDFYDYNKSAVNSRKAADRIIFLLDHTKIESDRYGGIRLFLFGGGSVVEDDPRAIHYHVEFDCRAGRKSWGAHNNTTLEP
jgi:hypothetical protein